MRDEMKIRRKPRTEAELMKRSSAERRRLREWHTMFAFFPVAVSEDELRWLETVERRCFFMNESAMKPFRVEYRVYEDESDTRGY